MNKGINSGFCFHGKYSLLPFRFVLSPPPWFPVLPGLRGWTPWFIPTSYSWGLICFSCTPFSSPFRSQLLFAKHQPTLGVLPRAAAVYGAVQEFSLPVSSFHWVLLVFQPPLSLSLPFKELLLSPEHSPSVLASWLQAAVVHICIVHHFGLQLPALSRNGDRATMNMMTAFLVKMWNIFLN